VRHNLDSLACILTSTLLFTNVMVDLACGILFSRVRAMLS
jgi:hypothetical protein